MAVTKWQYGIEVLRSTLTQLKGFKNSVEKIFTSKWIWQKMQSQSGGTCEKKKFGKTKQITKRDTSFVKRLKDSNVLQANSTVTIKKKPFFSRGHSWQMRGGTWKLHGAVTRDLKIRNSRSLKKCKWTQNWSIVRESLKWPKSHWIRRHMRWARDHWAQKALQVQEKHMEIKEGPQNFYLVWDSMTCSMILMAVQSGLLISRIVILILKWIQ